MRAVLLCYMYDRVTQGGLGISRATAPALISLYGPGDTRRDAGFSLFYMGINIGAFVAPYVVGTMGQKLSFHAGFACAAVGMAIGLVQYVRGCRNLGDAGLRPANPLPRAERNAALAAIFYALFATGHFTTRLFVDLVTAVAVGLPVIYFVVILRSPKVTDVERSRMKAYAWLFVASVFFWVIDRCVCRRSSCRPPPSSHRKPSQHSS
jgi:POT family proton-dependent oligopeptide transporter